jgi:penicillin-binding protein 1C
MRKWVWITLFTLLLISGLIFWRTVNDLMPLPNSLAVTNLEVRKLQVLDRQAMPLTITYQNQWNIHDYAPLHQIPEMLKTIFVLAEDKRFFEHHGTDWQARITALLQNLTALQVVRGASTITEQTVRMLHLRPRTFWSRWVESFEANQLEQHFSKSAILEFYLNQVPYADQRRGVVQAARYYFDRDLATLNLKEMLALAVLVRAPSRLDLHRGTTAIEKPIKQLAKRLVALQLITETEYDDILATPLQLQASQLSIQATHFINYLYNSYPITYLKTLARLHTTLDTATQQAVQKILNQRTQNLRGKNVHQGAVLVVDHQTQEVLAWVNAGKPSPTIPGSLIDAVTTPRQPGSTLKPFLYALALEKGWTAATLIDDAPLAEAVGTGLHNYRNYSRSYYGPLRLRDALGNSLNIPAIRTIQFVGASSFLQRLHQLGFASLTAHPSYYGDGLALGNGGVTLLELVQAYATLANRGSFRPLKMLRQTPPVTPIRVFSEEISSIIADILSDADARRLEFGLGTLLRFPVQTAVKTGTSTDYRDAWAVGFNHRYVVGVWLGNFDQQPMSHVSGATGPALILRAVFAELNRYAETQPLYLSPHLVKVDICRHTGKRVTSPLQLVENSTNAVDNNNQTCPSRLEWFVLGTEPPLQESPPPPADKTMPLRLKQPSYGLQLAMDPRIPDQYEAFALMLAPTAQPTRSIEWLIDGKVVGTTTNKTHQFLWPLQPGEHTAQAKVWLADATESLTTPSVVFYVK